MSAEAIPTASERTLAPVMLFGGVLSVEEMLPAYNGLLGSDERTDPPNRERFTPIPRHSLGQPENMSENFEGSFLTAHAKVGEPMVVIGHSLGAIAAVDVAMKHPDKVASVVCIAGAHDGVRYRTPSSRALSWYIRRPDITEHIYHESDYMQEHRETVATSWPANVSLHILSASIDDIIFDHGLSITLPEGQMPHRRIVAPRMAARAGIMQLMNPSRPADTMLLPSRYVTGHITTPWSGAVINYVHDVRVDALGVVPLDEPLRHLRVVNS